MALTYFRSGSSNISIDWEGAKVVTHIQNGMTARTRWVAQYLVKKVEKNISVPVVKVGAIRDARGRFRRRKVDPNSRSKPGEFPRRDTGRLRKDIFWKMVGPDEAQIGTTLDYGLILELYRDRSFLRRTMDEERNVVRRVMLKGPPKLPGQVR